MNPSPRAVVPDETTSGGPGPSAPGLAALAPGAAMKSYLSVKQVVRRLNGAVSAKLVYKLIATGKLRANRATGKVLVEEDSLVELMEGGRPPPVPEAPPPRPGRGVGRRNRNTSCGDARPGAKNGFAHRCPISGGGLAGTRAARRHLRVPLLPIRPDPPGRARYAEGHVYHAEPFDRRRGSGRPGGPGHQGMVRPGSGRSERRSGRLRVGRRRCPPRSGPGRPRLPQRYRHPSAALAVTKDGHPQHPLMLGYDSELVPFVGRGGLPDDEPGRFL